MSQEEPKPNKLRKKVRRRQVIALKAVGKTIDEICEELDVSNSTVDRDLASQDAKTFIEELTRRQIIDIEQAKLPMRLHFRSDLLEKLLPKRAGDKVEVNVNATSTSSSESTVKLLSEYDALIAAEIQDEAAAVRTDNPKEQVHPA